MKRHNERRFLARLAANLAWVIGGVGIYAICIDIFGGYPQVHSEALDWAAVVLIVLAGALVWYWHEHHDPQ
jgi:uncharacterized membrane protein YidH (DUF202 family)